MTKQQWLPRSDLRHVQAPFFADLFMPNGSVCRATFVQRGRVTAWWPEPGERRKEPIGLFEPVAFRAFGASRRLASNFVGGEA